MLSLSAWATRVPVGLATPALAVEHPQAQGKVAMLALVGATLTNGTAQIQTVSDTCN